MKASLNALASCLLLLAVAGGSAEAIQPREHEHRQTDQYFLPLPGIRPDDDARRPVHDLSERKFSLRHIYHAGSHRYPGLHRYLDVDRAASLAVAEIGTEEIDFPKELRAKAISTRIERMRDRRRSTIDEALDYAGVHGVPMSLPPSAWSIDEIPGPNTTDKSTVITFAWMAANAYVTEPWTGDWKDVKGGFNYTDDFGWEQDGLRGHIFADETNKTVVVGLKGTSMAIFDGPETTANDKINDNLFASCCCGQGTHFWWKQVCDCMGDTAYTCNNTCLVKSLRDKSHYYWAANDLYYNVTQRYPGADVWLTGHSLGGVVSSLLSLTHGLPTMTFEAYPDALAASRLGLPVPPGYHIGAHQTRPDVAIHHFGHTADPIFEGTCNAASSLCTIGGYALESKCHTGRVCEYDTKKDKGWREGVGSHPILSVIRDVLETYEGVANCTANTNCSDCETWKFFESNGTETTTSTTSTSAASRTRTEICKTPGWWGCLDPSTTSNFTSATRTTTYTTSICKTPGWFGCKDETTVTTSSTLTTTFRVTSNIKTAEPSTTSSSICQTPGWLGCKDFTSTTIRSPTPRPSSGHTRPSATSRPGPGTDRPPRARRRVCSSRRWYGTCKQWVCESVGPHGDL